MKAQYTKTGSRTLKGDQSIQATIDRYATKYPQWHPCTHGHLRKWARTKPGVKPVKKNLHLRYFSTEVERSIGKAVVEACDQNEGMTTKMMQEFVASQLSDEQLDKLKKGYVTKSMIRGIHKRMSAPDEQIFDKELPQLDSANRLDWRHYENYKAYFIDVAATCVKLGIGRLNTMYNWNFNETLGGLRQHMLQPYMIWLDPSRAGAADETDMPGGQKKWAGQKSTVFCQWSLGKKANKTRRGQGIVNVMSYR